MSVGQTVWLNFLDLDELEHVRINILDVNEKGRAYSINADLNQNYKPSEAGGDFTVNERIDTPVYQEKIDKCQSEHKVFKGFVLEVEVNDDSGTVTNDDDFAVGRNCRESLHPGNEYDFDNIKWDLVNLTDFITLQDLRNGVYECNLVIDRAQFPARN